jgi:hypothetical protein
MHINCLHVILPSTISCLTCEPATYIPTYIHTYMCSTVLLGTTSRALKLPHAETTSRAFQGHATSTAFYQTPL